MTDHSSTILPTVRVLHRSNNLASPLIDPEPPRTSLEALGRRDYLYIFEVRFIPRFGIYFLFVPPAIAESEADGSFLLRNLNRATFLTLGLIDESWQGERPW